MLLNLDTRTRPGEPPAVTRIVPSAPTPRRPAAAEPSWGRVLATTIKLWVLRQVTTRRGRTVTVAAAVAAVTVASLAAGGVFAGTAAPARARAASTPSAAKALPHRIVPPRNPVQTQAAAWIAGQLSSDATIACDPAMCAALQAQGVTAGRLTPLTPRSPDPHGATVVVTSAPAAAQATEAYAPAVIAGFGSGAAQIEVRAAEPGGAAAYATALRSDLVARTSAGSQLLRNNHIRFTAQDAAELRAGAVDARVLATLAALSSQYSFTVTAFGDASPGVAAVYREVTITGAGQNLAAALTLVQAQVPPYLPAQAGIAQAAGPAALSIEYSAPSPLGLLTAVLDRVTG